MLLGAVVGGLLAAVIGTIVAVVAIRVSGLLLALVTLAFALFADQSLFQYSWTGGGLTGVAVPRPVLGSFNFSSDRTFLVLCFVALVLCSGLVLLVQRGTVGRYLAAMRGSPVAAASMGISLRTARLTVFAMSAGLAGFGGALYGSVLQQVNADLFGYAFSLVFVVAVITTGSRTVEGAVQAGIGFSVIQLLLHLYLPARFGGIEPILFAFGAMTYAAHPEGIVEYQKSKWMVRVSKAFAAYDARRARKAGPPGRRRPRFHGRDIRRSRPWWRHRGSGSVAEVFTGAPAPAPVFGALTGDGSSPLLDAARHLHPVRGDRGAEGRVGVRRGGRGRGPGGPQRRGQDDVVQLPVRAAASERRDGVVRRARPRRHARAHAGQARDQADVPARGGVPGTVGARPHDRGRAGPSR